MANLVSPGFNNNALVNSLLAPAEERIIEFRGLNRRDYVEEGEMSDMTNLTSDNYPLLTPRKLRGTLDLPEDVVVPLKIMARYNKIAMIAKYTYTDEEEQEQEGVGFFFNGELIPEINDLMTRCFASGENIVTASDYALHKEMIIQNTEEFKNDYSFLFAP